ncbi:MAG TPA: type I-C CRISPR-associated protein Cas5c [Verrucomicrobiae bacterium]|nr:type I-C CRISPR-associated protein Cas5c [Verrucomicrobiae bacterium]
MSNTVTLRVWGDFACFTRPEMKVERVSYPVPTPSAARGILEAVFWEPEMYYLIDSIRVIKRGRWVSFRRNEVNDVIAMTSVRRWIDSPKLASPIHADDPGNDGSDGQRRREAVRAQRTMLALQEVEYLITAEIHISELGRDGGQLLPKYFREIKDRARQGKCYHRPALGVRECAADFDWFEGDADAYIRQHSEPYSEDFGLMLYDVFDHRNRKNGFRWLRPDEPSGEKLWKGDLVKPQPAFFHAKLEHSVMDCHPARVEILSPTTGAS